MSNIIGIGGDSPRPASVQINPLDYPNLSCKSCGGCLFDIAYVVKKISKMAVAAPTDQLVPVQILRCTDCGEVLSESLPHPDLLKNE
jgi:uncharacterized Zn finger protein